MTWNPDLARMAKDLTFDAGALALLLLVATTGKWSRPGGRIATGAACLALVLAGARGGAELLSQPLRQQALADSAQSQNNGCLDNFPVVVTLSGGLISAEIPAPASLQRVVTTAQFLNSHRESVHAVVFSGGFNAIALASEASVMAHELMRRMPGLTTHVQLEEQSANTYENAILTRNLLERKELGRNIILITSEVHLPRSVAAFRKAGLQVCPWAAPSTDLVTQGLINFHNADRFRSTLNEYLGFLGYFFAGWL